MWVPCQSGWTHGPRTFTKLKDPVRAYPLKSLETISLLVWKIGVNLCIFIGFSKFGLAFDNFCCDLQITYNLDLSCRLKSISWPFIWGIIDLDWWRTVDARAIWRLLHTHRSLETKEFLATRSPRTPWFRSRRFCGYINQQLKTQRRYL